MSLHDALGGLRDIAQWFVWRLVWSPEEGKYLKTPCAHDGSVYMIDAADPSNWSRYESVARVVTALNARPECMSRELQYALGFRMTADCGYWFFDLDKDAGSDYAQSLIRAFPGALVEWSSSGKGIHVIGRYVTIPEHRTKPVKKVAASLAPLELEFYHSGRGIAFGLSGLATGSADTFHDATVHQLCAQFFPPRAPKGEGDWDDGPREDWRGPADDDELLRRALQAKVSAEAAFGGKPSFEKLWRGECEHNNETDMALASHLAFWTGCDAERIERLMWRSGLVRDKWKVHRTYLRELTIQNACDGCKDVYQEPQRNMAVMQQMMGVAPVIPGEVIHATVSGANITPELKERVEQLLDLVTSCGDVYAMLNDVIPAIASSRVPPALGERLVKAINKQLDLWDNKLSLPKLRAMCFPPVLHGVAGGREAPLWVQKHCYVKNGDYFLDMENGSQLTYQGFLAEYGRMMPTKDNGSRENAVEWALHRWDMRTVHHVGYRPDMGSYFEWDGLDYANTYSAASVPEVASSYSEAGIAGIEAFQLLLWEMCSRRQDVFNHLLQWLAHNVQRPGIKIRWSPIIKGVQGDGKSLIGNVLRSAMGYRNVGVTGNANLTASGGFTDWAVGYAVNVIEEIWLTGKLRYQLYNATKEFITNDVVSINPKGAKKYNTFNTTNHIAFSNYSDALPLDRDDRRWLVIFTPWSDRVSMREACGLSPEQWKARTDAVDYAWKNCGGELRAWLMSIPVSVDINGEALETPEKDRMKASAKEDAEGVAAQIIEDGAPGISNYVISSLSLSQTLRTRAIMDGFEQPKGPALNHMLTRMGFSKYPKMVKWRGHPHTIWLKNGFNEDNDAIRRELDATLTEKVSER